MEQYRVNRVWTDEARVWAETTNGWKASYPFSRWKRLANASDSQRRNFTLSRYGIHWPEIDEDLSFAGMFCDAGLCPETGKEDAVYYQ